MTTSIDTKIKILYWKCMIQMHDLSNLKKRSNKIMTTAIASAGENVPHLERRDAVHKVIHALREVESDIAKFPFLRGGLRACWS